MVPELGAQDVLQSSQLFLHILHRRSNICCFDHHKDGLNRLRFDNIDHRTQSIGVTQTTGGSRL